LTKRASFAPSRPSAIYTNGLPREADDKSTQIRHLALGAMAASNSNIAVAHLDVAMISVFEVVARLAEEVTEEVEHLRGQLNRVGESIQ
jgi:hypothetical protein